MKPAIQERGEPEIAVVQPAFGRKTE